ncbi:MAG TPA: hypothetical protein VM733_18435 [Thermoanaerobaculia bacterium]|nr:hypothetical protein [Thermoanaerobaculia bacterium]
MNPIYLIPLFAVITALVVWRVRADAAPIADALSVMVRAEGWSELSQSSMLGGTVRGKWKGRAASVEYGPPAKRGIPGPSSGGTVTAIVEAHGPRLILSLRGRGSSSVLTRPIVVAGPPIVDLPHLPIAQRVWVRCDEASFAERILRETNAIRLITLMLNDGAEIIGDGKTVRIMRLLPRNLWRVMPAITERARETCRAATAVAAHYQPPR